jgi:phosphoserine phosphatase
VRVRLLARFPFFPATNRRPSRHLRDLIDSPAKKRIHHKHDTAATMSQQANLLATTAPTRPSARRANSSAFLGQLKIIQGAAASDDEVLVTAEGKTVRISATKYSIPTDDSVAVPGCGGKNGLLATLFHTGKKAAGQAEEVDYVSDLAIFEFIQTLDELMVPYQKTHAYHRPLDSASHPKVVEIAFSMPEMLDLHDLRRHEDLWAFEEKWGIEVVLQRNDVFRRYKRLAIFDMDSTLIQQEVIDEIARFVGMEDKVSAITARAMNGEIDFSESLRQRVALLKGVPATVFEDLKSVISFTPGARELCKALKMLGYKLAVLSGGFIPLANYVKEELGLDYAYANQVCLQFFSPPPSCLQKKKGQ